MNKLITSFVVVLLACALSSFAGCGILNKGVAGRYVFNGANGMSLAELSAETGIDIDEDFITFVLKENGDVKYTMEYTDEYGMQQEGSGTGTYEVNGDKITLNFTGVRDGITDTVFLRGTVHGTISGGKMVIAENGDDMTFVKA